MRVALEAFAGERVAHQTVGTAHFQQADDFGQRLEEFLVREDVNPGRSTGRIRTFSPRRSCRAVIGEIEFGVVASV